MRRTRVWMLCCALLAWPMWAAALQTAPPAAPASHELFRYDARGHRDPFVPLVQEGRLVGPGAFLGDKPVLTGILWDPAGDSVAMIDDQEVRVGDGLQAYKVIEIRKDAVVLKDGGEPVVLQMEYEVSPHSPVSPRHNGR